MCHKQGRHDPNGREFAMRLFLLTALTMVAFAANSILNRLALAGGHIGAAQFGTIRLMAGAMMLAALCLALRGRLRLAGPGRAIGVAALLVYIYGFSLAYDTLDAGLGALILFGMVQVTMFIGGLIGRERMPLRRWLGAALALVGLGWLLWPAAMPQVTPVSGAMMALAGIGWGIYSLAGRRSRDALEATAANFLLAVPAGAVIALGLPGPAVAVTTTGVALAVVSGALTSGLGYALWYALVRELAASVAAVAQLTAPVIAMAGGALLLGERPGLETLLASALVLGGVAVSVWPRRAG